MPTPALKSMATRYGVSVEKAEAYWNEAKAEYGEGNWAAVMGTVKKRLANHSKARSRALSR